MRDYLKHIGKNIRIARKNKGLTIDTLSELIGISSSFLGTIERGESSLSVETLISVCKTLGVSADSIILNDNPTPMSANDENVTVADLKDIIMILLSSASEDELSYLIDYIKLYRGRIVFCGSE